VRGYRARIFRLKSETSQRHARTGRSHRSHARRARWGDHELRWRLCCFLANSLSAESHAT